jgi:hypothetical protein
MSELRAGAREADGDSPNLAARDGRRAPSSKFAAPTQVVNARRSRPDLAGAAPDMMVEDSQR